MSVGHHVPKPIPSLSQPLAPTPEVDPRVTEAVTKLRDMLASGQLKADACIPIVRAAAALAGDYSLVEDIVLELAKGADGVSGTADDLIPPATLQTLHVMLHGGVVKDVVTWVAEFAEATSPTIAGCGLIARIARFVLGLFSRR